MRVSGLLLAAVAAALTMISVARGQAPAMAPASVPASPQPAEQLAAAEPIADEALVRELMAREGVVLGWQKLAAAMFPFIDAEMRRRGGDLPERVRELLREEFRDGMANSADAFLTALVSVYQRAYTASEVRELLAFYDTPLGRKIIRLRPELMRQASVAGARVGRTLGEAAARRAVERWRVEQLPRLREPALQAVPGLEFGLSTNRQQALDDLTNKPASAKP